ncbi:hypothetical protein OXX59_005244 [Metschnikowia pulcherrima]
MHDLILAYLIAIAAAVAIQASQSESILPSCAAIEPATNEPECPWLFSVSAHPPFVFPQDNRSPAGAGSSIISSSQDASVSAQVRPSVIVAGSPGQTNETLESKNTSMSGPVEKRALGDSSEMAKTPGIFQSRHSTDKEGGSGKWAFEASISSLYEKMKSLKVEVAEFPEKLEHEYQFLRNEYSNMVMDLSQAISADESFSENAQRELKYMSVLVEMMDLNLVMRQHKCGDLFVLVPEKDSNDQNSIVKKTKLSVFVDKIEVFGDLMAECYDDRGDANIEDPGLENKADMIALQLAGLKNDLSEVISQENPISKIFEEDLMASEERLMDLFASARLGIAYSNLPSKQISDSQHEMIFREGAHNDKDEKMLKFLHSMIAKLMAAYENNPQKEDYLDLEKFKLWRLNLHEACDETFMKLVTSEYVELPESQRVFDLLKEFTNELRTKANAVLLVTTTICSDGLYQGEQSLFAFSGLQEIIKSDIAYFEKRLGRSVDVLKKIESSSKAFDFQELKGQIRVEKAVLERISKYVLASQWAVLPYAESVKELERKAYDILANLENPERSKESIAKRDTVSVNRPFAATARPYYLNGAHRPGLVRPGQV